MNTGLTIKELGWIEEGLRLETLNLKLAGIEAQAVSDPQMRQFFQRCQQQAQQRVQQFSSVLASVSNQPFAQQQNQAGTQGNLQYGQATPQQSQSYPYQQPYAWQGGPH